MAGQIPNAAEQEDSMARVAAGGRGKVLSVLSWPGYDKMPPQLPVEEAYFDATRIVNTLLDFSGDLSHRFPAAGLLPVQWAETLLARAIRVMRLNYNALLGVLMCTVDGTRRQVHSVHTALLAMLAACQWGLPAKSARELGLIGLFCEWGGPAFAAEAAAQQARLPRIWDCSERNAPDPGTARTGREAQAGMHGTGPEAGLAGGTIALPAQILAIARTYAALIGCMPHTSPLPPHQALARMWACAASAFEREVLEHFIRCLGVYPVGGVVETQCGRRGLVIENTPDAPQRLTVRLLRPAVQCAALGPEPAQTWQAAQIATAYPLIPPLEAT